MSSTPIDMSLLEPICERYGVASLFVFGSVAKGEDRPDSDVDMLVSFRKPESLLTLIALERELSEALGRKVDLLTEEGLSPLIRDHVMRERQVLYGS